MRDGIGNPLSLSYPGGRRLTATFDELERVRTITDAAGGLIAQYSYIGPGRVERRDYGNGTRAAFDFDEVRRVVRTTHSRGATPFDDRSYSWDSVYRKTGLTDVLRNLMETFRSDSIYRLVESIRTPPAGPAETVTYSYDGVHNRTAVAGGADPGAYTRDATAPDPADRQVNQYTTTPFDSRRYDDDGNLTQVNPTAGAQQTLSYDVQDRLVALNGGASARYRYDALGRRIEKTVGSDITRFFFAGAQEIEEQDGGGETQATYVYGNYLDEPLSIDRGAAQLFYHADQLFNVTALTDDAGSVVESYTYGDFGHPTFATGAGTPLAGSEIGNPFLFTGRRYDEESELYHYRSRYLDPRAGRFITRDTIGSWGDPANLGNAYAYVGNDPVTMMDPFGQLATGSADYNACMAKCAKRRGVEFVTFGLVSTPGADAVPPSQLWQVTFKDGSSVTVRATQLGEADFNTLSQFMQSEMTSAGSTRAPIPAFVGGPMLPGGSHFYEAVPGSQLPGGGIMVNQLWQPGTPTASSYGMGVAALSRGGAKLLGAGAIGYEQAAAGLTSRAMNEFFKAQIMTGGLRAGATEARIAQAAERGMAYHQAGVALRGAESAAGRGALMRFGGAFLRKAGPIVAGGMFALDLKNCNDCCAKVKFPPGDC
jgi:RHS repeat-associated protein